MSNEVILIIVGSFSSALSSFITWLLAKKKYDAEVDRDEIQNMKDTLEVYRKVIEDNKKTLEDYSKKVENGLLEIHELRVAVHRLLSLSCVDTLCKKRKYVEEQEAKKLLRIKDEE